MRTWEVATGEEKYVYRGHVASVNSIVWSPDSQRIASGSSDKTVQVWDAATGAVAYTYRGYNVQAARFNSSKGGAPQDGAFVQIAQA